MTLENLIFSQLPPLYGFNPKGYPPGSESPSGFHLSWSHYRALMRVENNTARQFYETEAAQSNWSRRDLERQIPEDAEGVRGCPLIHCFLPAQSGLKAVMASNSKKAIL